MHERVLYPFNAPRELDDRAKRGAAGVGRGIDERAAGRAEELSTFEDEHLGAARGC